MKDSTTAAFGLPYSPVRKVGDLYFISGHTGVDIPTKTAVFLTDMGDFEAVNDVYVTYFDNPMPARSAIAVRELPRVADVPLKVEVEAIAHKIS